MPDNPKDIRKRVENYLIDEFGHYLEQMGGKQLMGRIWGLLLTRSEPLSLKVISEHLQVSKPAVSTTINLAVQMGVFKKVYNPEFPRENFFELGLDSMEMMIDPGIHKMELLLDTFKNALDILEASKKISGKDEEYKQLYKRLKYVKESMQIVLEEYFTFAERVKLKLANLKF